MDGYENGALETTSSHQGPCLIKLKENSILPEQVKHWWLQQCSYIKACNYTSTLHQQAFHTALE